MSHGWRLAVICFAPLLALVLGVVLFSDILLPVLVGLAAAYMLDPAADWLERHGFSRTAATGLITGLLFILLVVFLVLLLPALATQAAQLALELPNYVEGLRARVVPTVAELLAAADLSIDLSAEGLVQRFAGQAMAVVGATISGVLQSGIAFLNLLALIFVTPIVTFYLLRDWDRMVANIREQVPPDLVPAVDRLALAVDEVLAGFIRGQGMVCGFLALFYGLSLWAVGLRYGLIIGLLTGFFSFIPYIGMALGLAVGLSVAAFQFQSIGMIALVAAIFGLGQFIEGNLISPRLVGSRIHLHPVWMIFAALAGAALFGLAGTLLAVPVAGVLGVMLRFGLERYRASRLYAGSSGLMG